MPNDLSQKDMLPQDFLPNVKTWSFSALNQHDQCPYRYYVNKVGPKAGKEPFVPNKAMDDGNAIHKRIENHVKLGLPIEQTLADFAHVIPVVNTTFQSLESKGYDLSTAVAEEKILLDRSMTVNYTDPFDPNIWLRVDADHVVRKHGDPTQAALTDWKTGKFFKRSVQGAVNAMALFAVHPELQVVESTFTYFKTEDVDHETFRRDTFFESPNAVAMLQKLIDLNNNLETGDFPKKRSGLCGFCHVRSCEFSRAA